MNYSVIIPAYNAAAVISRAIDSCLSQTLPPLEIIIVDDGSTDVTSEVLQKYSSSPPVVVIHHEQNQGVSAARNTGWNAAQGEWVAFLDSDDEWHPQKMEICAPFLSDGSLQCLCHLYQYASWEEEPVYIPAGGPGKETVPFSELLLMNKMATCSLVVRRDFSIRFDNRMRYCEDHDFLLRSGYHTDILRLLLPLARVHRRINSRGGLSGALWKMRKGELLMYFKLLHTHFLFVFLIPFLMLLSLAKHLWLLIRRKSK
ncbi:MAG: glycosyltransferase family 2 protein [Taibaiella sp.]|nr:glycosyltransferase family 2 protein [Taibaiella sp.]